MKYINAKKILPQKLIEELQNYIQGGYVYIPVSAEKTEKLGRKYGISPGAFEA